jgi:hypothetical protein
MSSRAGTVNQTRHSHRFLLVGLTVILLATAMAALPTPATAAMTEEAFEVCLLEKINASRAEVGAVPLTMAWDRNDDVRAWSVWMSNNTFRHMTSAERNPILPPNTYTWGENIAMTSAPLSDCDRVHQMFMNSPGHRANILSANKRFAALGAHSGPGWWVTELFFSSSSYDPGCDGTFCDDDQSMFEADIEALAAAGVTKGCNPPINNEFCPKGYVTRGEMAAFLTRMLDLPDGGGVDFTDDDDSVFERDIERLAAAGITKGCNPPANDEFCPNSRVTRQTMAAFLVRALDLPDGGSVGFTDDDDSVFEDDIERLAAAGITKGCNPPANTQFCPNDYVTRETMAAFMVRAMARVSG